MPKKLHLQRIFDISVGNKLKISIWIIPIILSAYFGGYISLFCAAYISAIFHELAHILCATLLNVKIDKVSIYPFGISARLKSGYIQSSEKEFYIAIAGPFCSLILFWLSSYLYSKFGQAVLLYTADTNLALCLINLIPALPLDGGRIFKAILTLRFGIIRAYNFMLKFSRIIIVFLLIFALVFILVNKNFSLILICSFLLQNLVWEQQAISQIALKEIMSVKEKANANLPSKVLCVFQDRIATHILKQLSYDRFCVVNVLDENCKIIKTLTEAEILNALIQKGLRTKYGEI